MYFFIPKTGLEPVQLTLQPPQDCVSTNFTTSAINGWQKREVKVVPISSTTDTTQVDNKKQSIFHL